MKPLVSIIVPIYNVEKYLRKCIDSILNQTLENIEVILVNDGSTDSSGKIIDEYKLKDKRIKVVHKENEGQSSARNIGLDIANGEYIGFVDSDDWIDRDLFELGYKYIKQNNGDIGVFSRRTYTEQSDLLYEIKVKQEEIYLDSFGINNYIVERLLNTHTLGGCNKLYKHKILVDKNIKFDSVKYIGSEDTLFNYKVLQHANKVVGISNTYYNCLARDGSTARSYDKEYMLRINNLLENIQKYSLNLQNKDNSKSITPIMLIHFLNRNIIRISNYSNENISHSLAIQLKQAMSKESIKENMKYILSDKSYLEYIRKMGYSTKGIIYIKIFSLLCMMKRYKLAAKFITMRVN